MVVGNDSCFRDFAGGRFCDVEEAPQKKGQGD